MTKAQFLDQLQAALAALPDSDRLRAIAYYDEMLDDLVEDGIDAEQAVASLGPVEDIACQLVGEDQLQPKEELTQQRAEPIVHEQFQRQIDPIVPEQTRQEAETQKEEKPKNGISTASLILIICGFPIWGSLLLAMICVIAAIYIAVWSIIVALFSIVIALFISGVALFASAFFALANNGLAALAAFGASLICIALGMLFFLPIWSACRGLIHVIRELGQAVRRLLKRT